MLARNLTAAVIAALSFASFAPASLGQTCGTTVPPGLVTPGAIWGLGGSPYCVTGDIQVSLLTIKPGVRVLVDGAHRIDVLTSIQCQGTRDAPVVFESKDSALRWQGIKFANTGPGSSFTYTFIEDTNGSGIDLLNCAAPSFTNCVFGNNTTTGSGGGINANGISGPLNIIGCEFSGNSSTSHGGALRVLMDPGAALVCEDTTFFGNTSNYGYATGNFVGGAIYMQAGDAMIRGCVFDSNRANSRCSNTFDCTVTARGGAIYIANDPGTATLENCAFSGNISDGRNNGNCFFGGTSYSLGAGIYVNTGTVDLRNCTLGCGNAVVSGSACGPVRRGGGLYVNGGTVTIDQSTIARNSNATGLYRAAGSLDVTNSIVFDNNAGGTQIGGTVTATWCDVEGGYTGVGNISFAPAFAGVGCACGDLTIVLGSPCIDAGDPSAPADGCFPPAWGTAIPDMGAHGGPLGCNWGSGLTATPTSPSPLSVSSGGVQTLLISPGSEYALDTYVLLGSFNGFAPGFEFGGFCIPLNIDTYLNMTVGSPGQTTLSNSIGVLDGGGNAQAQFSLPATTYPVLAGFRVYHAAVVLHVTPTLLEVAHVTNPVSVEFTP